MAIEAIRYTKDALEKHEAAFLAPYAFQSASAFRGRTEEAARESFRTEFQRDRDRIIHSRAFRRLKQKTQVFMPDEGDHFRTRLSHTLEVSQLSRTVARSLALNEDLVEAVALAHDLGHAPFGHSGEEILHKIMSGEESLEGEFPAELRYQIVWEGFKHNHQSLRLVDLLEYKYDEPGLNLTHAVREGILRHTSIHARSGVMTIRYHDLDYASLSLDAPFFLEGQIVRLVDEIAQHTHDIEDGFRAQVITLDEVAENVPLCRRILSSLKAEKGHYRLRNTLVHDLIDFLICDLSRQSFRNLQSWAAGLSAGEFRREWIREGLIAFSDEGRAAFDELSSFVIRRVIHCQEVDRMDARAAVILPQLFRAYLKNPRLLPDYLLDHFCKSQGIPPLRGLSTVETEKVSTQLKSNIRYLRSVCDYIAGMTDAFAIKEFQMTVVPTLDR